LHTDPAIIAALNEVLGAELLAINQYFLHAKMCENWGYNALAGKIRAESIDEMRHAETLIDRILTLNGQPEMDTGNGNKIGTTVPEMLKYDLQFEEEAVQRLNRGIALCREKSDNGTGEILTSILALEEQHIEWLETQMCLVHKLGEELYLAGQLGAA